MKKKELSLVNYALAHPQQDFNHVFSNVFQYSSCACPADAAIGDN